MARDLNDTIAEMRLNVLERFRAEFDGAASSCGSPIEAALFWAMAEWAATSEECAGELPKVWSGSPGEWEAALCFRADLGDVTVTLQAPTKIGGKDCRLDFRVRAVCGAPTVDGDNQTVAVDLAVECDGHDFHERTKEQARRDRKRDRDLQALGYTVLRFTGSEIARDPRAVAKEIVHTAETRLQALYSAAHDAWAAAQGRKGGA
jgi:very-short-patch-repair endonuclease